jgi:hypothetical protein
MRHFRRPPECLESSSDRAMHTAVADFTARKLMGNGLEKLITVGGAKRGGGVGDRQRLALGKTDWHRRARGCALE